MRTSQKCRLRVSDCGPPACQFATKFGQRVRRRANDLHTKFQRDLLRERQTASDLKSQKVGLVSEADRPVFGHA